MEENVLKTCIFLGAGASSADGAPLQKEIIKQNSIIDKLNLKKYMEIVFMIDINHISQNSMPSFEELLGMLDISISNRLTFKNFSHNEIHFNLIEKLDQTQQNDIFFISTNYDILIDNALLRNNYKPLYGFQYQSNQSSENKIRLYKLHGSLNWLHCPCCNSIKVTEFIKCATEVFRRDIRCTNCGGVYEPIIIPPTYFKDYENTYLKKVWFNAEKKLQKTERIIFCGYSFSDADMQIKYLIKKASLMIGLKEVLVFNKSLNCETENRYKRFFGENIVQYLNLSFQDFCENPHTWLR